MDPGRCFKKIRPSFYLGFIGEKIRNLPTELAMVLQLDGSINLYRKRPLLEMLIPSKGRLLRISGDFNGCCTYPGIGVYALFAGWR